MESEEPVHTYICVSDDYNGIVGYKNAFLKMIQDEIDQSQYKSIQMDDGIVANTHYLFCVFRFESLLQ